VTAALYVVGGPGSGKSTLMAAYLERIGATSPAQIEKPVPHVVYATPHGPVTQVGRLRGEFSGTDALGYAIMPAALSWVTSPERPDWLVGEGDRLATSTFLRALVDSYDQVTVVHMVGSPALIWQRMFDRAVRLGRNPQTEAWWRGRLTKAHRLAAEFGAIEIPVTEPTNAQVDRLFREMFD
jgi:hypothetical protein